MTQAGAKSAFQSFRSGLHPADEHAVNIYWPGDWGVIGLTQASYPFQRRRALDSVTELAEYFRIELDKRLDRAFVRGATPKKLELRVIAHSLGCLVALELLKLLNRSSHELTVTQLVLMAAAVPQYRLSHGDLGYVFNRIESVTIYYSRRDWVLALCFPAGELPHRPFPEGWAGGRRCAIGRHGCGRSFENVTEEERLWGHSGYWADSSIATAVRDNVLSSPKPALRRAQQTRIARGRKVNPRTVGSGG